MIDLLIRASIGASIVCIVGSAIADPPKLTIVSPQTGEFKRLATCVSADQCPSVEATCNSDTEPEAGRDVKYFSSPQCTTPKCPGNVVHYRVLANEAHAICDDVYISCVPKKPDSGQVAYHPGRARCVSRGGRVYYLRIPGRSGKHLVCAPRPPIFQKQDIPTVPAASDAPGTAEQATD